LGGTTMKKIISEFQKMPKREVIDCRITGLRDILSYYGIHMDSYTLFILSEGIDFGFQKFKLKESSNIDLWCVGGSTFTMEDDLLSNLGIGQNKHYFENSEQGWNDLKAFIDKDIPIMVVLDSNVIHEFTVQKDMSKAYFGAVSSGPLVGYDLEERIVWMDFKDDVSTKLHPVPIEDFMMARNTKCVPYSPNNECYVLDISEEVRENAESNMNEMLLKALNKSCRKMIFEQEKSAEYFGLSGMRAATDALREFGNMLQTAELSPEIENRLFSLKIKTFRQGMLPGSNTFYRDEFGNGLIEVSKRLKIKSMKGIGKEFRTMGKHWRNIARYTSLADAYFDEKQKYIESLIEKMELIFEDEKALFTKLYDIKEISNAM